MSKTLDDARLGELTTAINLGETEKALALIDPLMALDGVARGQHRSPLFSAIETSNVPIVEALIDAGASLSVLNDMSETPLQAAVVKGGEDLVRALIARGADVNAQIDRKGHQYDGRTALMYAAATNNLQVAKLLIRSGADPLTADGAGLTALAFAEIFGKRTANYLRKVVASSPAAVKLSLHEAAGAGLSEHVAGLLNQGVAVDERDEMKSTALHRAAIGGHIEVAQLLVQRGAPVDARNAQGNTALTLAKTLDVVQLLLGAGADPNVDIGGGLTPFLCQARSADADVLAALIDGGANLDARSADGRTLLDHAKSNRPESRRLLKSRIGLAADAVDLLRDEMKDLPRMAAEPAFKMAAEWVGGLLNRKPTAWKRRKGVLYFHDVAIVKHLTLHFGDADTAPDAEVIFTLLERLQNEILARGFTLVYIDAIPKDTGRLSLILLPTPNKYAALLACGTNGINQGHDTEAVIAWLMKMEAEHPFVVIGCGHDFLDGRLTLPVANAEQLAMEMIAFCPDMVEQAAAAIRGLPRSGQVAALSAQLSASGSFGFWWD